MLHGKVLCQLGESRRGLESLRKAARISPREAKYPRETGETLLQMGMIGDAIRQFQKAASLAHDDPVNHYALGRGHLALVSMDAAIAAFEKAHTLDPDNLEYRYALASSRLRLGELPADTTHFEYLVERRPDSAVYQTQYGNALLMNNEFDAAEQRFRRVLECDPGDPDAIGGLAEVLEETGRTDEAADMLERAVRSGRAAFAVHIAYVRICRRQKRPQDAVALLERLTRERASDRFATMTYHYRLGALYEEIGDYDRAWAHWTAANQTHVVRWDRKAHEDQISAIIDTFDETRLGRLPRSSCLSETPVFVVGMFRSGTSLTDQILSCHPEIHGAGERTDIPRIAATMHEHLSGGGRPMWPRCAEEVPVRVLERLASEYVAELSRLGGHARFVTDKNPWNYVHLGLIWMLFPGARIIHVVRDPLDTCLSCYANSFSTAHAYTQNLGDLGHAYVQYRRLMAHWRRVLPIRLHEVRYENLVSTPEPVTRETLGFLELEWDPICLRFHESKRVQKTLSVDQIRRPLYTGSVGRARRFDRHLDVLKQSLEGLCEQKPNSEGTRSEPPERG